MPKYLIVTEVGQVVDAATAEAAEVIAEANISLGADANVGLKTVGASVQSSAASDVIGSPAAVTAGGQTQSGQPTTAQLKAHLRKFRR